MNKYLKPILAKALLVPALIQTLMQTCDFIF